MDFRTQVIAPGATSRFGADALLLVIAGQAVPAGLDEPLADAVREAVAQGDLTLKPGKVAYLRQVQGVKAPRVIVAVSADTTARALKVAAAAGLGVVKGLGARHLGVMLAGYGELQDAHAEAVASAASEAVYVYRTTKPSAPAAPKLDKLTLLASAKTDAAALGAGLARAAAVAEGVTLARELANRPGNHCTPTLLAAEARKMARAQGLKVEVMERKQLEKLGMG
ncbi:MAG: leucyl aminopeptidase, partial [Aquabacterium sp.]|nr:leucyl aminopeptidase [Aquabacterium sp.]